MDPSDDAPAPTEPEGRPTGPSPSGSDDPVTSSPGTESRVIAAKPLRRSEPDLRAAASAYRADSESRRDCLEPLLRFNKGLVPIAVSEVDRWVTRLAADRVLLLTCVDPEILNAAGRTLPFHARFNGFEALQPIREEAPTIWEILSCRLAGSAVVVVYAAGPYGERFLRTVTTEAYWLTDVHTRLENSSTWLLILTTPTSARASGLEAFPEHPWTEVVHDFIGPRLRAALGDEAADLEQDFRRQKAAGLWGESDERCVDMLTLRAAQSSLRQRIEDLRQLEAGRAVSDTEASPTWSALLGTEEAEERALYEVILFVAAFFKQHPEESLPGLPVTRFDAIVRSLIPAAAEDAMLVAVATPDDELARRLERLWAHDGRRLRTNCGLRTCKPTAGGMLVALGDPLWRNELLTLFAQPDHYWLFSRLSGYVRCPEFILGPPDMARGALEVAFAQASVSADYDDRVLLEWILACAPPTTAAATESERLADLLRNMPRERRAALTSWLAELVRTWDQSERVTAALGLLVDARCHDLVVAVLQRLWRAGSLADSCLSLAKRLLNEAPADTKAAVIDQMRRAIRREDLPLFELWNRRWIVPSVLEPNVPARAAAQLLVEACEWSLADAGSPAAIRGILQAANPQTLQAMTSWLWHPAVDVVVEARSERITGLPGLWMLPPEVRRRVVNDPTDADQALLTVWWLAFTTDLGSAAGISNPLSLMFRAMVVTDWLGSCDSAPAEAALTSALSACVPAAELAALRQSLRALDVGFGEALELLMNTSMMTTAERRDLAARLRLLRDQLRKLRHSTGAAHPFVTRSAE